MRCWIHSIEKTESFKSLLMRIKIWRRSVGGDDPHAQTTNSSSQGCMQQSCTRLLSKADIGIVCADLATRSASVSKCGVTLQPIRNITIRSQPCKFSCPSATEVPRGTNRRLILYFGVGEKSKFAHSNLLPPARRVSRFQSLERQSASQARQSKLNSQEHHKFN